MSWYILFEDQGEGKGLQKLNRPDQGPIKLWTIALPPPPYTQNLSYALYQLKDIVLVLLSIGYECRENHCVHTVQYFTAQVF